MDTIADREQLSVEQALRTRHSVRAFLPTPVPREQVQRLLGLAALAPSNSNCQPWHVHVLSGAAKRRLTSALCAALDDNNHLAAPEYPYQPARDAWPEPMRTRRHRFGTSMYRDALGIRAGDTERRRAHHWRNYDFFGAPVGLILTVSRHPLAGALVDGGLFLQALMLAAREAGLDTCPQACFTDFSPVLREHLDLADDELIMCGLSLGYADPDHALNRMRMPREAVSGFSTFYLD